MNLKKGSLVVLALLLCQIAWAKAVTIKGNFKNSEGYKYIYLYKFFGPEVVKIDSVNNSGGSFTFKFKEGLERGFYKLGVSDQMAFVLILGDEDITVETDLKNPANLQISGSVENQLFEKYKIYNQRHSEALTKLDQEAQVLMNERNQNPAKYNAGIQILQGRLDSLNKAQFKKFKELQSQNPALFMSRVAGMFALSDTVGPNSFFTKAELSDPEYTRGDMLSSKVSFYFQRYVNPDLESWKQAAGTLLSLTSTGTKNKEVVYITLTNLFMPYDPDYSRSLANTYYKEYPNSAYSKAVLARMPKGAPQVGDMAPEITLTDPSGKNISLSSLKGRIVLLDFWASWCGPCRRENPNVVRAYEKYKDKGFTIYSVSLDNNKDNWVQAIAKDGLSWESHVSDLKGWKSDAAALYHVKGIPAAFLLDRDGKIVATNLRGNALEQKLEELLSEK